MYSKKENRIELCFNHINSLCDELDYLASPDIEENMVCSLDCCIGNSRSTNDIIEVFERFEEMRSIIGTEGLNLVQQLDERIMDACYNAYDSEKGFSKKPRWLDFVVFINTVNTFLKDAVKRYEVTTEKI